VTGEGLKDLIHLADRMLREMKAEDLDDIATQAGQT
jgi:hypothetical protein